MKQSWRWQLQRTVQRLGSVVMAIAVGWSLWLTGSALTWQEASHTLWERAALGVLHWQLGDWIDQEDLSPATVLTLSQSAFLEVACGDVLSLWSQEQGGDDPSPPTEELVEKTPVLETPILHTDDLLIQDNGVEALTLTPSGSDGYLVCNHVYISSSADVSVTADDILQPFSAALTGDGPAILIIHTHTTEAYTPVNSQQVDYYDTMRTFETDNSVVAVGAAMADTFEAMGIEVIHDTTIYDYPSYNDSYGNALTALEQHIAQNPSIAFVIDVHRDAIEDEAGNQYKLVTNPDDGTSVAQLTLVVGTDGGGLSHDTWLENLRLATALQENLAAEYPTLMRPLLLRNSRYNQHITTGSLLLEVGSAGNAPEEAIAAGILFAQEMGEMLLDA